MYTIWRTCLGIPTPCFRTREPLLSLLSNDTHTAVACSTVCANVKGGKAGLEARSAAISARLEHLYSVQGIDRGLKDASLTEKTRSSPVKKEDPDALEELERLSLSGSRVPAFNGSPASRRNWKQEIVGLSFLSTASL